MSEMIERVAKAIYEGRNGIGAVAWNHRQDGYKAPYRIDAKAAIEAMKEPTDAMFKEGYRIDIMALRTAGSIYEAMIGEALK